jgi:hypothetical protein
MSDFIHPIKNEPMMPITMEDLIMGYGTTTHHWDTPSSRQALTMEDVIRKAIHDRFEKTKERWCLSRALEALWAPLTDATYKAISEMTEADAAAQFKTVQQTGERPAFVTTREPCLLHGVLRQCVACLESEAAMKQAFEEVVKPTSTL